MCLQSRFHQIFPFSGKNMVNWGWCGGPIFFPIGILIFLLLKGPYKSPKLQHKTLLGETAHFGFCTPKIVFFRGEYAYFCYLGAHAKFQHCTTSPSGRNSPFRLLSAQNKLFWEAREGHRHFLHSPFCRAEGLCQHAAIRREGGRLMDQSEWSGQSKARLWLVSIYRSQGV